MRQQDRDRECEMTTIVRAQSHDDTTVVLGGGARTPFSDIALGWLYDCGPDALV